MITPRYDYTSAAAAEAAYASVASRPVRPALVVITISASLFILITLRAVLEDPDGTDTGRVIATLTAATGLLYPLLLAVAFTVVRYFSRLETTPDGDAAQWYQATVRNIAYEGRLLIRGGVVGAAITAGLGTVLAVAIARRSGVAPGWDGTFTMFAPGLAFCVAAVLAGLRFTRTPEEALRPWTARVAAHPHPWLMISLLLAGVVGVLVGAGLGLLGSDIPGFRTFTEVDNDGVSQPGFEFPVTVAHIAVLPYLGGVFTVLGWLLIAQRITAPRLRAAVLAGATVATLWIAALSNLANHVGGTFLWNGAVPAVLLLAALLSMVQAARAGQTARAVKRPAS